MVPKQVTFNDLNRTALLMRMTLYYSFIDVFSVGKTWRQRSFSFKTLWPKTFLPVSLHLTARILMTWSSLGNTVYGQLISEALDDLSLSLCITLHSLAKQAQWNSIGGHTITLCFHLSCVTQGSIVAHSSASLPAAYWQCLLLQIYLYFTTHSGAGAGQRFSLSLSVGIELSLSRIFHNTPMAT